MDGNECKTKENIHNSKRKLKITRGKNYLQQTFALFFLVVSHDNVFNIAMEIQSTPDNSNLQGKLKKIRVSEGSSYRESTVHRLLYPHLPLDI